MEMSQLKELSQAMQEGVEWASKLTVGMVFNGTHYEGRARYPDNEKMASFFGSGALTVIKSLDIYCAENNRITHLEHKRILPC